MNCDQVFDVLTRGPFPTGGEVDALVDEHLDRCPSCARIAEALRPAPELFQEALSPRECRSLPGYWTDNAPMLAPGRKSRSQGARRRESDTVTVVDGVLVARRAAPQPNATARHALETSDTHARLLFAMGVFAFLGGLVAVCGWPFA